MAVTWRPPELRLSINQSGPFHRELPWAVDRDDPDERFDFTGWTARLRIVDAPENEVVVFATSGEDGVITLGADGTTDLDLAAEHTAALPATVEVAGVIHSACYGELIYTSPDGEPYTKARVVVEIVRSPEP